MKIIFDGRPLTFYPFGQPGFSGGTEGYVKIVARGLAERGHLVHVVTPDLQGDEQRGPSEFWWGPVVFPTRAEVVVAVANLHHLAGYSAEHFILMPNGIDPWVGDGGEYGERLSAVACFTQCHVDLLTALRPTIPRDRCIVTGLGVNLEDYVRSEPVPGRMLWANDPVRGLDYVLGIFDHVRQAVPDATLHVAYDFDRQYQEHVWRADCMAEILHDCKRRIDLTPGVVSVGALSHHDLVVEQRECHVHALPSDPPNAGSQIHGLTQLELAAAGVPLVLSDIEALPEIFGDCARFLPPVGSLRARTQEGDLASVDEHDWADVVVELMRDEAKWKQASEAGREVAARHQWSGVIDRWDQVLASLQSQAAAA